MMPRAFRFTRFVRGGIAALLGGAMLVACSTGAGEPSTTAASQADTSAGLLHTHVTRDSWHPHLGENRIAWDDASRCRPRPLELCPLFDEDFGIATDAGGCATQTTPACPDRVDTWDNAIVIDFATALSSDCRFGQWAPPLLSDTDLVNYLNDLLAFTLQLFGCPAQGTTGPLTFGLIPSALAGRSFTTADLDALADLYSAAVAQALSDGGAPPLTAAQAEALDAVLTRLAHGVPHTTRSDDFTFSTCPAGTPAPPEAADGDRDCP